MRFLALCSYLCAGSAVVLWAYSMILMGKENADSSMIVFSAFLAFPAITQLYYTARTHRMFYFPHYKETKSLDDFLLNDIESNDHVIGTNFWLKMFSVVNCILLCLFFLFVSYLFSQFTREFTRLNTNKREWYLLLLIAIVYLFAIPTVIYNIRTFNLKRIRLT